MKKLFNFILAITFWANTAFAQNLDWTVSHDTLMIVRDSSAGQSFVTNPISTSNADSTLKLIYWIHGLAGSTNSWEHVQMATEIQFTPITDFPERLVRGYCTDYSQKEGLNLFQVGSHVNNDIYGITNSFNWDTVGINNRIAIAHSQGGLVARSMRALNHDVLPQPEMFGGLITFGTPHNGTVLINNSQDQGEVQKWIGRGCERMTSVHFLQIVNQTNLLTQFVISPSALQNFSSTACTGLKRMILPVLIDKIRKPIASGYAKNADVLDSLNKFSSQDTIPVLAVYGVEEEPVFWRAIHSMSDALDTNTLSGSTLYEDPFGLSGDSKLKNDVIGLITMYNNLAIWHQFRVDQHGFWLGLIGNRNRVSKKAEIYANARDWFANANSTWKRMIGARYDSVYIGDYQCWCDGQVVSTSTTPTGCWQYNTNCIDFDIIQNFTLHIVDLPNDGIVTVKSQKAYPGVVRRHVRMQNTNHMQMRNSLETRRVLNEIFNGQDGVRFEVNEK